MKGVILAGGLGSRLDPLTRITNKHLLPIFNKPMIYYPIHALVNAGIDNITIITGGYYAGDFIRLLANGKDFGLRYLNYAYQEGEGGIADALSLAEPFVGNDKMCVILGDNIIEKNIREQADKYREQKSGAKIILKEVSDPERFGVPIFKQNKIISIEEKPDKPQSNFAVTGIYFYDSEVFSFIKRLKPSERGELEISDVNNMYIEKENLTWDMLDGWWTDAGTFESLLNANNLVAKNGANHI